MSQPPTASFNRQTAVATITAATVIGAQIAAKATRDSLFLSHFGITDLPMMLIGASLLSIVVVLLVARLLKRFGPGRVTPAAFVASSLGFLGIWLLFPYARGAAAILLYLHTSAFGVVLISGFWSLVNERFDPHSARRVIGRIVAGGTFGGLVGGLLAERLSAGLGVSAILPTLAALHLVCMVLARGLQTADSSSGPDSAAGARSAFRILRDEGYLRNLALIVFASTVAAALLDYIYKDYATRIYTDSRGLLRFFAIYYVAVGVATFVVQTAFSRLSLERLGSANTIAFLPFAAAAGGAGVLIYPGLAAAVAARFAEAILRNSLFRSAYELFFVPIPPTEKRATKTILDVGFDRLGDTVGGGLIKLVLILAPLAALPILAGLAVVLSAAAIGGALLLRQGYVRALEKSLRWRSEKSREPLVSDKSVDSAILQTLTRIRLPEIRAASFGAQPQLAGVSRDSGSMGPGDELNRQTEALRSGRPELIRPLLASAETLSPELHSELIQLLAFDACLGEVIAALRRLAPLLIEQLTDALRDPYTSFAVRRRIPLVFLEGRSVRAEQALVDALGDPRFEVRFKSVLVLGQLRRAGVELSLESDVVLQRVRSELAAAENLWSSRRLLDPLDGQWQPPAFDKRLSNDVHVSLQHLFSLLALVFEREHLLLAFRGLQVGDTMLRGTALEYLDAILPTDIRDALWPRLGDAELPKASPRDLATLTQQLRLSAASLELKLRG